MSRFPRPLVQWLASAVEIQLQANDHKKGWEEIPLDRLLDMLEDEVRELRAAADDTDRLCEAGDVGAVLAFIATFVARMPCDTCRGSGEYREHASCRGAGDCACGPCASCMGTGRQPPGVLLGDFPDTPRAHALEALRALDRDDFLDVVYGAAHQRGITLNGAPLTALRFTPKQPRAPWTREGGA